MADNNPTPWQAELEADERVAGKKLANYAAGWTSFGVAVLLLLIELFTTLAQSAGDGPKILGVFILSTPALLILWICAVVFGIKGRGSIPGKIGLALSVIDLGVYAYLLHQYLRLTF